MRDFKRLQEDPPASILEARNVGWDGTFKLTLEFSEEYPNKPPVVKFLSKMFHQDMSVVGANFHACKSYHSNFPTVAFINNIRFKRQ